MQFTFRSEHWQGWRYINGALLLLTISLLVASFEASVFSLKRAAADGHVNVYMAQQFLANPASFFSYAPPPAHGYMPEIFICTLILFLAPQLTAWQIIGIANIAMSLVFVWLLSVFLPKSLAALGPLEAQSNDNLGESNANIAPLVVRICLACTLLAFLNFDNTSVNSFFGLDATNAHMGSYVTSLLLVGLILGKHKPITQVALITFCALGIFSSKLVLASAAAPLLIVILTQSLLRRVITNKDVKKAALLLTLSLLAFVPNLTFSGFEALHRTSLSVENILPSLHVWMDFLRGQVIRFDASKFTYCIIVAILLFHAVRHFRHPMSWLIMASLLVCFLASLATETFRGWNLRHFGGALFIAVGFFIAIESRLTRPALVSLMVLTSVLAVQNSYDFSYPETREQKLANCLKPLLDEGTIKRGLAGHWDSEPVNQIIGGRYLIKTTLRGAKPEPFQWMVDTAQNHFNQEIDFALENKANQYYKMTRDNLQMLPGHRGKIKCQTGTTIIHLYDAAKLGVALVD